LVQSTFIWASGNERIDEFIQEKQLKIKDHSDVVFEWIPYNQFNEIKKTGKNDFITVYSAIWKNGPLYKKYRDSANYTRDSNKKVALKCLFNSKDSIEYLIDEVSDFLIFKTLFLIYIIYYISFVFISG
jgi:hypothetical protein